MIYSEDTLEHIPLIQPLPYLWLFFMHVTCVEGANIHSKESFNYFSQKFLYMRESVFWCLRKLIKISYAVCGHLTVF